VIVFAPPVICRRLSFLRQTLTAGGGSESLITGYNYAAQLSHATVTPTVISTAPSEKIETVA